MLLKPDDFDKKKKKEAEDKEALFLIHKQSFQMMSPHAGKLTDYPSCGNCSYHGIKKRGNGSVHTCPFRSRYTCNFVPPHSWCKLHKRS